MSENPYVVFSITQRLGYCGTCFVNLPLKQLRSTHVNLRSYDRLCLDTVEQVGTEPF